MNSNKRTVTVPYISAELGRHQYFTTSRPADTPREIPITRLSRIPDIQHIHRAKLPCSHCDGYHNGESIISLEAAHTNAMTQLIRCRDNRTRREVVQAQSNANHDRREMLMTRVAGGV